MKRLALLLLAVPALAACGSASKPTASPAPTTTTAANAATLVDRADAACHAYHLELGTIRQPVTLPQLEEYAVATRTALARMVGRLELLRPRTAALDAFIAASRAELGPLERLRAAAAAGSVVRVRAVAAKGVPLDRRAHALAVKAHLTRCAETPKPKS